MPDTAPPGVRNRSIPGLDGLRGLSVVLVIVAHRGLFEHAAELLKHRGHTLLAGLFVIDPGDLGVSVFFVISGFLITTLLLAERRNGPISLKAFYLRRFFRIFPPYYAFLVVIGLLWTTHHVIMLRSAMLASLFYISNYVSYAVTHPEGAGGLVGHTWSLSLEEQFYLIWPLCLALLSRRKALQLGTMIMVLAPLLRVFTLYLFPALHFDDQIFRMFHTRVDTIMAGCILALLADEPEWGAAVRHWVRSSWFAAGLTLLLLATLILNRTGETFHLTFGVGLEGILLSGLLFYSTLNTTSLWARLLANPVLRHLGIISYGIYLWQQLFVGVSLQLPSRPKGLFLLLILLSAELSYWTVEKASFSLRKKALRLLC